MSNIECRGRNGWFMLHEVLTIPSQQLTFIDLYSKRRGENPPIAFMGPLADLKELFQKILENLNEGETKWIDLEISPKTGS